MLTTARGETRIAKSLLEINRNNRGASTPADSSNTVSSFSKLIFNSFYRPSSEASGASLLSFHWTLHTRNCPITAVYRGIQISAPEVTPYSKVLAYSQANKSATAKEVYSGNWSTDNDRVLGAVGAGSTGRCGRLRQTSPVRCHCFH